MAPADDDFTRARDAIEDAVAAAEAGDPVPSGFPPLALVLFNRFGQTLRSDEAIELRRGYADSGPRYTVDTRRTLLLSNRKTYQEELDGIGWISEVDGNGMSCRIRLRLGLLSFVPDQRHTLAVGEVPLAFGRVPDAAVGQDVGLGLDHGPRLLAVNAVELPLLPLDDIDEFHLGRLLAPGRRVARAVKQ